jgi:hypothetical protein
MDRGIKIAILAACLLSLGFGLIWDRVIDGARTAVLGTPDPAGMGPDRVTLKAGSMNIDAPKPASQDESAAPTPDNTKPTTAATAPVGAPTKPAATPTNSNTADGCPPDLLPFIKDGKYTTQKGDGLWKICYHATRFRFLRDKNPAIDLDAWRKANPGVDFDKLGSGKPINIPK